MATAESIRMADGYLSLAKYYLRARRRAVANAVGMKRLGDHSAWAKAMNSAIKSKRRARLHADAAYHALYGYAPHWRDVIKIGDKIKTTRAGRTGRVVKTYKDGSAAIRWDNAPKPLYGAHERMPRSLLIRASMGQTT